MLKLVIQAILLERARDRVTPMADIMHPEDHPMVRSMIKKNVEKIYDWKASHAESATAVHKLPHVVAFATLLVLMTVALYLG